MKLPGHYLLKLIAKKREISLAEASKSLPKRFGDHRDYYVLSTLYAQKLIGTNIPVLSESRGDTNALCKMFYAMSLDEGDVKSDGLGNIRGEGKSTTLILHCTATADIYLSDLRSKRVDNVVALSIGIIIAVVSSALTAYFSHCVFV